jgi:hypothetical protein
MIREHVDVAVRAFAHIADSAHLLQKQFLIVDDFVLAIHLLNHKASDPFTQQAAREQISLPSGELIRSDFSQP